MEFADAAIPTAGGATRQLVLHHRVDGLVAKPVSYTHLRAHETVLDLVCRLLLEKKTLPSPSPLLHNSFVLTYYSTHNTPTS